MYYITVTETVVLRCSSIQTYVKVTGFSSSKLSCKMPALIKLPTYRIYNPTINFHTIKRQQKNCPETQEFFNSIIWKPYKEYIVKIEGKQNNPWVIFWPFYRDISLCQNASKLPLKILKTSSKYMNIFQILRVQVFYTNGACEQIKQALKWNIAEFMEKVDIWIIFLWFA